MTLFAALLLVLSLYVGNRWLDARAENARLRSQVAVLERRLARRRD